MNLHPSAGTRRRPISSQRGVTLVELMVGLVIGLLATLVIAQVAIVFEGQKRSTTGGSDAQLNGALALQTLQRDIQLSGYGIATGGGAGCTLRGSRGSAVPPWDGQLMVAARIVDGTDVARGSPDSLFILHSKTRDASLPIRITSNHTRDEAAFFVDPKVNVGNAEGDLMVVVPPLPAAGAGFATWCTVFNVSATPAPLSNSIAHAVSTPASGPWNHDGTSPIFPELIGTGSMAVSYTGGAVGPASHLINLGTMTYREYSLSSSALQMREVDNNTAQWVTTDALFQQIVNLQAVYGRDTSGTRDNIVDVWDTTAPTTPDGWARVIAVRIALVARSNQYEKEPVTTAEPTWMPDGVNTQPLKVDHLDAWQHYRYKVFEAAVPLRNMLWQS